MDAFTGRVTILTSQISELELDIEMLFDEAKQHAKNKNKPAAILSLKKKKLKEARLETLKSQLVQVNRQIQRLQSQQQAETMRLQRQAAAISERLGKELTPEEVEQVRNNLKRRKQLKKQNGFVIQEGRFKNRACFDKCRKKTMAECDSIAAKFCDTNTYCNPSNRLGNGIESKANGKKLLCQPASSRGGKRKKGGKICFTKKCKQEREKRKTLKKYKRDSQDIENARYQLAWEVCDTKNKQDYDKCVDRITGRNNDNDIDLHINPMIINRPRTRPSKVLQKPPGMRSRKNPYGINQQAGRKRKTRRKTRRTKKSRRKKNRRKTKKTRRKRKK